MSENNIENKKEKQPKKKGPIRFEAIIPVLVLSIITFAYFSYYFDRHLKSLIEYIATQGNGAEVNVGSVKTSFIKGSFDLNVLQVTDKEKPSHNMIEIENVHFQYLWDALLRMKFVVEDASINNIQLSKPRKSPGHVLPPEPAKPSKINEIQNEVFAQVKNKYGSNVLGDLVTILEGGDYKAQLETIRGTLKSELRVKEMITDVNGKKDFWDGKVKTLSDTSKLKEVEEKVNTISKGKNVLEQAKGIKDLGDLLKDVQKQYKEIETSSKQLQAEVKAVSAYPNELQNLVKEDIAELKDRFKIPKLDFKDMAMHLFAGEFAEYIAKARKYQALAKQYIPEKKENKDEIIPPKRSQGENYTFPVTTGYPLFWLKRAALSSSGTQDSYSGKVSGELTNITNAPKQIQKPMKLDMKGDFPTAKIMGVNAVVTIDHTQAVGKQSAMIKVGSFAVPEKLFVNDKKLKFGFQNANGSSTVNVSLIEDQINMSWNSALSKPQFVVETSSKMAKEILSNVLNNIQVININGSASGTFKNLDLNITSNLGDELGSGFSREIGLKLADAQDKVKAMIDEKINAPKDQLMAAIGGNNKNLASLGNVKELYAKNEDRIKEEIEKLKKGGGLNNIKEQGKKLFKGIKF
jgi:uncharacterized protein (TIGR03545 family)